MQEPSAANQFQSAHARLLTDSFQRLLNRPLYQSDAQALYHAPFPILSHSTADDPILTYGNLAAQTLWEMPWDALTQLPSRLTAEPMERSQRGRDVRSDAPAWVYRELCRGPHQRHGTSI